MMEKKREQHTYTHTCTPHTRIVHVPKDEKKTMRKKIETVLESKRTNETEGDEEKERQTEKESTSTRERERNGCVRAIRNNII